MSTLRVFLEALRRSVRLGRGWLVGCAAGAVALVVWLSGSPALVLALAAGGGAARVETALADLLIPVVLSVFAVELGSRSLGGDAPGGMFELLLAYPLRRGWLALAHLAALAVWLAALAAVIGLFLGLGLAAAGIHVFGLGLEGAGRLVARLAGDGLAAFGFGGLALAAGSRTGRAGAARAAGLGGLALAALLSLAAPFLPGWLVWVSDLSPLYWLRAGWVLPLAALAVLAGGLAAAGLEQREVG